MDSESAGDTPRAYPATDERPEPRELLENIKRERAKLSELLRRGILPLGL